MKLIKTTPDFLPLEKFNFTDEQLIEMYNCVFDITHSDGFKKSEIKDLLFNLYYQFIEKRKENWEEKLKSKILQFEYRIFKVNYTQKQTAVEWLEAHLIEYGFDLSAHKFEIQQAKEMDKEQKKQEYLKGVKDANEVRIAQEKQTFKTK